MDAGQFAEPAHAYEYGAKRSPGFLNTTHETSEFHHRRQHHAEYWYHAATGLLPEWCQSQLECFSDAVAGRLLHEGLYQCEQRRHAHRERSDPLFHLRLVADE